MIYTYGNFLFYRHYMEKCKNEGTLPKKSGISYDELPNGEYYGGGAAFETAEQARRACVNAPEPYGVFALDGNFEEDTYFDEQLKMYRLKNTLVILYEVFEDEYIDL